MAKEKVEKKSEAPKVDDRRKRWEADCAFRKEYNPSAYDTQGGDAQLATIPESFK